MKKTIPRDSLLIPENADKVFDGRLYQAFQWRQPLFDGTTETFEMLKRRDTVGAICITGDKIIVMDDEQSFKGMRKSFPGGSVSDGDRDIVEAAKRELAEETGYAFDNWKLIKVTQPFDEIEWFTFLFVAWGNPVQTEPNPDAGEKIGISLLDFDEVKSLVMRGSPHMGVHADIFTSVQSVEDLLDYPVFAGQGVDR